MHQLEGTKCSFLLCLGMSIIICSVIYMRTRVPTEPKVLEPPSCRSFSTECKALLPSMEEGVERYRRDCQVGLIHIVYRQMILKSNFKVFLDVNIPILFPFTVRKLHYE